MSEREPGWYWVLWQKDGEWLPSRFRGDGIWEVSTVWISGVSVFSPRPATIGPRMEPPSSPSHTLDGDPPPALERESED